MGFWIFMFIFNMLIPLMMIGFGNHFIKHAPKKINNFYGYRTSRSMKNKDTWAFAHNHCGRLWRVVGLFTLAGSVAAMLIVIGKDIEIVGILGSVIMLAQCVVMIIPIFFTEAALKKRFDKDGNVRE